MTHPTHQHEHDHDHDHDHDHHHRGVAGVLRGIFAPHSHDPADSVDTALESSARGIRAVKVSLVVLLLTALAQLVVVLLTDSVALLADTIHNFSDALTAVPLWIAFVLARRPASRRYTHGYGRAEDLAGVFIVAMILLSAVLAGYESVRRLIDPAPIGQPWVVVAAGVLGFVGNEWVALYRIRTGRRIGSAALVADGVHARTDGFTSLAVAAGGVGVLLGFPLADPIVGIAITVAIVAVLRGTVVEVFRRLMDGTDPALAERVETAVRATPGVLELRRLRLRWDGHRLIGQADVAVAPELSLAEAIAIADDAGRRARRAVPALAGIETHPTGLPAAQADPARG